jgi:CBS domain-containing protein
MAGGRCARDLVTGSELAGFLAAHPPFDALDPTVRATVAAAATVDAYEPGQLVLDAFADPTVEVFVVVTGGVDLWNDAGRVGDPADEQLGPGGVFGFSAMLTERSVGPRAVAVAPTTVARIPAAVVEPAFISRRGARFLAEQFAALRPTLDATPTYSTVDDLVRTRPVVVAPDTAVADLARDMTSRGVAFAVVDAGAGRFGLVTDAGLRQRVIAEGVPGSAPVSDVMDPDPPTLTLGQSAAEGLILLLDRGADYVIVLDRAGGLSGVVTTRDFAISPSTAGVSLHEQLRRASTVDELVDRARRVSGALEDLLSRGLASGRVIAVHSSIVDTLVRRALALAFAAHPELSVDAFTWLSLGSNGRREALLSSDVDSAVAFDNDLPAPDQDAYRAVFAEVDAVLARAGARRDEHGVTAAHPVFSRTNAQWRAAGQEWLARPDEANGAMMTSLLVDGRPIHGDPGLPAVTSVFGDLRRHPGTMRLLLQESLASRARMRSLKDLLVRRPETFEIKTHAVLPVVNIGRWSALAAGSQALPTVDRLRAAAGSEMLPADRAEALVEVFDLLQRLRLRYQLRQHSRGDRPSDLLTLDRLSPIDRSLVAEAVREIAAIQRRMTNLAAYLPEDSWTAATP